MLTTVAAAVERDAGQPVGAAARRSPVSTDAPVKSATNAEAGARGELGRACPRWTTRPRVDDADAVAEQRRLGEVVGDEQRRHAGLARARAASSRAARGARARVERGRAARRAAARRARGASARASATRWRSPPDSVARPGVGERRATPKRSSSSSARRAPLARGMSRSAVGDVLPRAQVRRTARSPGTRSRSAAARAATSMPRVGVEPDLARRSATRPRSGRSRPGDDAQHRASCPRPTGRPARGSRRAATSSATSSVERPEPRRGLNAQHRRARPCRSSSLTASSSAAETATSTADSASAPVKSVEKRS